MLNEGAGFVFAVIAAICNGSFLVPFKIKEVTDLKTEPLMFQLYASVGIFISSWILVAFISFNPQYVSGTSTKFVFDPLAMLAGCLVVLSMSFSFFATRKIGVALAQGIFGGLAIIVSYIWGSVLFDEQASSPVLSAFGIIFIVIGVTCIGACKEISTWFTQRFPSLKGNQVPHDQDMSGISLGDTKLESGVENNDSESLVHSGNQSHGHRSHGLFRTSFIQGVVYAILCGLFGGSSLVPIYYIPVAHAGFAMYPGFGLGALITAPCVLLGYCRYYKLPFPQFGFNAALYAGVVAGIIWMANCAFTIGAIPVLGYSVAFPLVHCSVFVSGLWGIYLYQEFNGFPFASVIFFSASVVLLAGAVMISVGK